MLNQPPTITLMLSGLFLIAFDKDKKACQAAILEDNRHCLKVKVVSYSDAGDPTSEINLDIPSDDLKFEIPKRTHGVNLYQPGPFSRSEQDDKQDYRWMLDLESAELHGKQLTIKPNTIKRKIQICHGLFYNLENRPVRIVPPLAAPTRDVPVAKRIGCAIYLGQEDKEAVLRYGPKINGKPSFSLILSNLPGVRYEISLDNTCPDDSTQLSPGSGGGDFAHYYDIVDVSTEKQFKVESIPGAPPPPPGEPRNPCDPAGLSITEVTYEA